MRKVRLLRMIAPAPPVFRFPAGRVGYAVGDIHGRADLLALMIEKLEAGAEADRGFAGEPIVIFLGDYVDRGRDSAGVIDLLLAGGPKGFERRFLKGNHEQAMLAFLADPLANRAWVLHGGAETMRSYKVTPPPPLGAGDDSMLAAAEALKRNLPAEHMHFLNGLDRFVVLGDYLFVHAGVDPARSLAEQTDTDLYWIRGRFLYSKRRFTHRVVHGHTPVDQPVADLRRVAVDTGAYASGTLTAARFEGDKVDFIAVSERDLPSPAAGEGELLQF